MLSAAREPNNIIRVGGNHLAGIYVSAGFSVLQTQKRDSRTAILYPYTIDFNFVFSPRSKVVRRNLGPQNKNGLSAVTNFFHL